MSLFTPVFGIESSSYSSSSNGGLAGDDHETTIMNQPLDDTNASPTLQSGIRFEVYFLIAVCLLGFIGNALVLVVYSNKKYRRSNAGLYVLNLAVGDTMTLIVVVGHLTEFFRVTWPVMWSSDLQCAMHRYFRFVGFDITVFTMVAIAIDRYFAVCHPLTFRMKLTPERTKLTIAMLWLLSVIAAIPTPFWFKAIYGTTDTGVSYKGKTPFACKLVLPDWNWIIDFKGIYLNVFLCFIPTFVTAVTYIIIVVFVWRSGRGLKRTHGGGKGGGGGYESKHWTAAKTLLVVFVAYLVSYVFFAVYNIISQYGDKSSVPAVVKNMGLLLPYANSCMNPMIYSLMHGSFRKACVDIFMKPFRSKTSRNSLTEDSVLSRFDNHKSEDQGSKQSL